MAWNETSELKEKLLFIAAWHKNEQTMVHLCKQFNISRKTGYKIIARYEDENLEGLKRRSRAHHYHPNQMDTQTTKIILDAKKRYPKWGSKKIKAWLEIEKPQKYWPSASSIGELFKRNGLTKPKKRKYKTPIYSKPFIACTAPNIIWSADYKGDFKLGLEDKRCYPLTISDNYSRFILGCKGLYDTRMKDTQQFFERIFKEYGLPMAIRTDNGKPFSSPGLGGLTQLSIWWIKLGILHERIKPGHPEQNGRHERMHRTLKEATAKPPYSTMKNQQRAFNRFMDEFNFERPHDALNQKRPADIYYCSERKYPKKIPTIEYDTSYLVRKVRQGGDITWDGRNMFISESLRGEYIGLKEIYDGIWQIHFSNLKLAELDYRKGRVIHPT